MSECPKCGAGSVPARMHWQFSDAEWKCLSCKRIGRFEQSDRCRIAELEAKVAEWQQRAVGGLCRMLSVQDCNCSLCQRDREIERLRAENYVVTITEQQIKSPSHNDDEYDVAAGGDDA
ncbi:MAG TPA: hypothetical protein VM223_01265 [Planctomycetota bacterium]|nr:hypothetical protein [Planctomycetota bacterium]